MMRMRPPPTRQRDGDGEDARSAPRLSSGAQALGRGDSIELTRGTDEGRPPRAARTHEASTDAPGPPSPPGPPFDQAFRPPVARPIGETSRAGRRARAWRERCAVERRAGRLSRDHCRATETPFHFDEDSGPEASPYECFGTVFGEVIGALIPDRTGSSRAASEPSPAETAPPSRQRPTRTNARICHRAGPVTDSGPKT